MIFDQRRGGKDRRLDWALPAMALVALEVAIASGGHRRVSLLAGGLLVAVMSAAVIWRRSAPLTFAGVTVAIAFVLLTSVASTFVGLYVLLLPAYTVAALQSRPRAVIGLGLCLAGPWAVDALAGAPVSDWAFTAGVSLAAWATGRALRARQMLARQLQRNAQLLTTERESHLRLAIADERSQIARELHAAVAVSVSAMVVQAEAAQRTLDEDAAVAERMMAAIEETGRQALSEMRRVLGILRRAADGAELAPQPGVGQIHTLVERARRGGRTVELLVEGEPGPLSASADLAVYRIIEEVLVCIESVAIALRFRERDVELQLRTSDHSSQDWPTLALRERVTQGQGEIEVELRPGGDSLLKVRIPRVLDGVLA